MRLILTPLFVLKHRRKGIGKSLLKSAVSHFQSDVLKFTNVDCDCESVTGFLSSLGLTPKGQQFEMVRNIYPTFI